MEAEKSQQVRYFVATGRGGGWLIFREGKQRAIHRLAQKVLAVETAKTMAREDAPSQVIVERGDGSFRIQYSFGQGAEYAGH